MRPRTWLCSLLVVVALLGVAGCGGSDDPNADASTPTAHGGWSRQEHQWRWRTPNEAAAGFSDYFAASARSCGKPVSALGVTPLVGGVSPQILDSYSCRNVMTAAEVQQGCYRDVVRLAPGAKNQRGTEVASGQQRFQMDWSGEIRCPIAPGSNENRARQEQGSYEVTVEHDSDVWIVTAFKVLTGPGAGHSSR
ncbi:hypothetical protein AB3X52_14435 [Nocardioides sp. DS6]|uniref:Secreted protein n=1 Tax=Nocardioides eburneus TaxID=3231482 RepID=A0ABV3T0V1_9ACTN